MDSQWLARAGTPVAAEQVWVTEVMTRIGEVLEPLVADRPREPWQIRPTFRRGYTSRSSPRRCDEGAP